MSPQRCVTCRFFETRYTDDNTIGYCRRYPPQGFGRMIADWSFAMVRRSDWCGEWRAVEEVSLAAAAPPGEATG